MENNRRIFDFVVLGSGIAGITFALQVADMGSVALVTKKDRTESNTNWAQGGIAGVQSPDDSYELHIKDTLIAGAGLCHEDAVDVLVREGPARIHELIDFGVNFTKESDGDIALTMEGGHSRHRIAFHKDLTGQEIERALVAQVAAHPAITVFEHHSGIDLAKSMDETEVCGVYVLDTVSEAIETFVARIAVFLATGGCGHVYSHTTNPSIATGDGVGIAFRAGAKVANMEFIQFHPTTLYYPGARSFLISEAVRGEGGILRDKSGRAFMKEYDERGTLAPRDIVARAIDAEMTRENAPCMYLDITHKPAVEIKERFPTIYAKCLSYGIDMTKEPIPVVPAAHYMCGGVVTDLNGKTNLKGLFASGEVSCTGVHGANRLASNSLLESLVFSYRAVSTIGQAWPVDAPAARWKARGPLDVIELDKKEVLAKADSRRQVVDRVELQTLMWDDVGLARTGERLEKTQSRLSSWRATQKKHRLFPDWEDASLLTLAHAVTAAAAYRHESRGAHYRLDHPRTMADMARPVIVQRRKT
jgi:L-aspartate oxidase